MFKKKKLTCLYKIRSHSYLNNNIVLVLYRQGYSLRKSSAHSCPYVHCLSPSVTSGTALMLTGHSVQVPSVGNWN